MNTSGPVSQVERRMSQFRQEYDEIAKGSVALAEVFGPEFVSFAGKWKLHPDRSWIEAQVETYCRDHRMWDQKRGPAYVTMSSYLYTKGDSETLAIVGKFVSATFYLDDVFGNDVMLKRSEEERKLMEHRLKALLRVIQTGILDAESAHDEMVLGFHGILASMADKAPVYWYKAFIEHFMHHYEVSYSMDSNITDSNFLSVVKFIELRNDHSGLEWLVDLATFATRLFHAEPSQQINNKLGHLIRDARCHVCIIGGLSNDLFSFEKEVLDEGSYFNLVPCMFLNNPGFSVQEAIFQSGNIVKTSFHEYQVVSALIRDSTSDLEMHEYMDSLDAIVMSCWIWQIETARYRRKGMSIFSELNS